MMMQVWCSLLMWPLLYVGGDVENLMVPAEDQEGSCGGLPRCPTNTLCFRPAKYLNPRMCVHPSWKLPGDLLLPKPPYTPSPTAVVCDVSVV
uniref:Secreted protein n=2 Tax=Bursaphelenchus xylophilus TaxID=6326 RepID=A0A1I7SHF2_BURXY